MARVTTAKSRRLYERFSDVPEHRRAHHSSRLSPPPPGGCAGAVYHDVFDVWSPCGSGPRADSLDGAFCYWHDPSRRYYVRATARRQSYRALARKRRKRFLKRQRQRLLAACAGVLAREEYL